MRKQLMLFAIVMSVALTFLSCSTSGRSEDNSGNADSAATVAPQKINAEEAYKMMGENPDAIILDVRTKEEFDGGHIQGAVLIPDTDITSKAEDLLKDKSAVILVYCRSGRRSALAAQDLSELGYTSVYDFGGIIDWPYETVTE